MRIFEYRAYGNPEQYAAIDEAIRTTQFVRNKCIRLWMDAKDIPYNVGKSEISKHTTELRADYTWAKKLNATAVQAAGDRAWDSISRFYKNVREGIKPVGYPRFRKTVRSVEYKHSGWKLRILEQGERILPRITFLDGCGIGTLKLKGTWDTSLHPEELIKRVRLVRKADGYYVQLGVSACRKEYDEPTGKAIGIDVGLESFYTDSEGTKIENPRYLRKSEKQLRRAQRRVSRKFRKGKKQSANYKKAKKKLGKKHSKVSRQRKDHAIKAARCVVMSNDFIAFEDLKVRNMVKNKRLSKSINDAGWYQFRVWLEYYGKVYGKITVAVSPEYTSQECSNCGELVKKTLSTRTHLCRCGLILDRDHNAALNILDRALRTVGHTGTWASEAVAALLARNACGEVVRSHLGANLAEARRIPRL